MGDVVDNVLISSEGPNCHFSFYSLVQDGDFLLVVGDTKKPPSKNGILLAGKFIVSPSTTTPHYVP